MIEILNRFLIQHRSISIPGLGTLHAERVPARLSEDASSILPPGNRFRFDKYFDAPDKEFFTYLATHQQVPDYEAMRLYNQFAQDFRAEIMAGDGAAWEGIGKFTRNTSGEIEFAEDAPSLTILQPVELKRTLSSISADILDLPAEEVVINVEPREEIVAASSFTEIPEVVAQEEIVVVPILEETHGEVMREEIAEPSLTELQAIASDLISETSNAERWRMIAGWIILAIAITGLLIYFGSSAFNMKAAANQSSLPATRP